MKHAIVIAPLLGVLSTIAAGQSNPGTAAPADAAAPTCIPRGMGATPDYRSVEVLADRRVTFKLCAPAATDVRLTGDFVPYTANGPGALPLSKDAQGLWSVTLAQPLAPDNYRFNFSVHGVTVADPQGNAYTHERAGLHTTFEVPGAEGAFQAWNKDIAHGLLTQLDYWSKSLGVKRRAHVYLPPDYHGTTRRYPVLYLVHGAGDSDHSWSNTGHAHYIMDNLIAAGRAQPMIVVMPDGHTPPREGIDRLDNSDFGNDLLKDLLPLVERSFRTQTGADQRAMAGLSMGGLHTLRFGLTHPELFHYLGVFSIGLGLNNNAQDIPRFEAANGAALKRAARELKLLYYAMGKDDFLYASVAPTRAMLDRAGIRHEYHESGGGHEWANWRRYLHDFAPRLFRASGQGR